MAVFTDIFIKRPVLASVVSLLILLLGLRAIFNLPLRQFPKVDNTVIKVTTAYPGANADVIQGFVTTKLEKSIAGAEGIDYLSSSSQQNSSEIDAQIKLNFDPNVAFTNVMSKVSEVRNFLPQSVQDPVIQKETGSQIDLMYIGFNSDKMSALEITDYLNRAVLPKLETVSGVSHAQLYGAKTYAMRIWIDPQKLTALNLSPNDVAQSLLQKNYLSAAGSTKGYFMSYNVYANTDMQTPEQFQNIMIKTRDGSIVRLKDVAKVELGPENYDSDVYLDGKKAIFIGISATPTANPLTVISDVKAIMPEIIHQFPPSLKAKIVYDATEYIRASIHEVIRTIIEATVIVVIVIFLFVGSMRSVLIPIVTIPLSLVGVCSLMLALGYSINLLTLLAMVLAIGLVVDDAIVVVENINRHKEFGRTPFEAALEGAREIAVPVISMTITLAAVYAPIGFMGGLTGSLFKEFAFTLACSVIISGVVALTLSPMLCSKILKSGMEPGLDAWVDAKFEKLRQYYQSKLDWLLENRSIMVVFSITVLTSCVYLYLNTSQELAPDEDQSIIFSVSTAPQYANIDYTNTFAAALAKAYQTIPEMSSSFIVTGIEGPNSAFSGINLVPWNQRKRTQKEILQPTQDAISKIAGFQSVAFPLPSLPVSGNLPIQFELTTIGDFATLYDNAQKMAQAAQKSGLFLFIKNDLRFDQPQLDIHINQNKVSELGISMEDIGNALATSLGGNYINYFNMKGRSYEVIPQLLRQYRLNPQQLNNIYVHTAVGTVVPLSTFVELHQTVQPSSLTHFQQLNSALLEGLMMPGKSLGEGLNFLETQAQKTLPTSIGYDFAGQSRQYIQEGSALLIAFFFSIIIIFLVLAAQFESFRDPLIVLISVPMSICGALIPLNLGLATINIYTQIGLITLIGLISKHGILMVDFANELQIKENLDRFTAIKRAAAIRLRPILMTTAAMVIGVLPLIFAEGAGAVSRFDIGLVIASGMLIGTCFTLFVVPTVYSFISADKRLSHKNLNQEIKH